LSLADTALIGATREQAAQHLGPWQAEWLRAAPAASIKTPPPTLLGGAATPEIARENFQSRIVDVPEAGCLRVQQAYVYDYGLIIKDDMILLDRTLTVAAEELGAWGYYSSVKPLPNNRFTIERLLERELALDRAVVLLRRGDTVHGHWLLEVLPRILLARAFCEDAYFVVASEILPYQLEMLALFGIPAERIVKLARGQAIYCREVLVPSLAHTGQSYIHPFSNATFNALIAKLEGDGAVSTAGHERLFVTRASRVGDPRPLLNVSQIEEIARSRGFQVIDPGRISWPDQVMLFAKATHIVGLCGSGMHNTVFTGSKAHVLTLQPNQNKNFLQTAIAALRGHQASYLLGESLSGFDGTAWETPYLVDAELFDMFMERMN
jgi:Glycosyltransferase 61